jgi:hypothetical protein
MQGSPLRRPSFRLSRLAAPGLAVSLSLLGLVAMAVGPSGADASRYVPDPSFGYRGVTDLVAGNGVGGTFREVRDVRPGPEGATFVLYAVKPSPTTS